MERLIISLMQFIGLDVLNCPMEKDIAKGNKCVAPSYKEKLDDIVDEMFS